MFLICIKGGNRGSQGEGRGIGGSIGGGSSGGSGGSGSRGSGGVGSRGESREGANGVVSSRGPSGGVRRGGSGRKGSKRGSGGNGLSKGLGGNGSSGKFGGIGPSRGLGGIESKEGSKGIGSRGGVQRGSGVGVRGKGSSGRTIGGGSLLENSIFDAIQNVGRRNDGGGQSKSSRVNRITSGGLKQSQSGSRRKTGKRKPSLSRILNNISEGNREQSSIRDDGASFQSEDYSSSNDRINPYRDYFNTAGKTH